jgi:hypothetical protein
MKSRVLGALILLTSIVAPARVQASEVGRWMVVSYPTPIRSMDRDALATTGARAIVYRPVDTYVAWMDDPAMRAARGIGLEPRPLEPGEKLQPALRWARTSMASVIVAGSDLPRTWRSVSLLATIFSASVASPDRSLVNLIVSADDEELARISTHPNVLSIGPGGAGIELLDEQSSQIVAGNVSAGQPVPGYAAFLAGLDLDGTGVRLAIADSGIDDLHPDLADRVAARTDFTPLPDVKDSDGHGTHVAGIAGGSGMGLPNEEDPKGMRYGLGVAPNVTLIDVGVLGIIEETVGIDELPPFEQATSYASRQGAIGWNASWGTGDGDRVGYVENARTMDILTRDADWTTPGQQPFTLVFAAGNSGTAGPGAPSEAKNLISVAASRSARAGNIETIAAFSSRGPALDGRIGPTIAAPGENIVSTRATASVLCNTPPREAAPAVALYATCSGTSMAAPHVAGSIALITQWWRQRHDDADPSPAMHKALLVNSATDMGPANIPNGQEGWGRVTLRALFDPDAARVFVDQEIVLDEIGATHDLRIETIDPSKPMKVTLAWSDAPGAPGANPALVNDLDLSLRSPDGTTWLGNRFLGGRSVTGGSPDRREVLENVFLAQPGGVYDLTVSAANLPGDGVPGTGDATDQDFALVITNARLV